MSLTLEPNTTKKIKIILDDYPYANDIALRIKMSEVSHNDICVLEQILYSSIKTSVEKLIDDTDLDQAVVEHALKIWMDTGLVKQEGSSLVVDKELRKYFELEIQRFEEDFTPDIDFFAQLLKKPPIHALPIWYALPRTSTNIFESIIEKYLQTPQIYQRFLLEFQGQDPLFKQAIDLLFTSDELKIGLDFMQNKLGLSQESLYEMLLVLEYNMVGCVVFEKENSYYKPYIALYSEYKNYLEHLRKTECPMIEEKHVQRLTLSPFAYVEGLITLLKVFKNKTFHFPLDHDGELLLKEALVEAELAYLDLEELIQKLIAVQLIEVKTKQVLLNETSFSFMSMKPESAALVLYRHPYNKPQADLEIPVDKAIRECEKAATRLLGRSWVLLEDFEKGLLVPFSEEQQISLKKVGRRFNYQLPTYQEKELEFIRFVFTDWFEKVGVIETGFFSSKPCIRLSPLGTEIFS